MIDQAVAEAAPVVGVRAGCAAVGEAQALVPPPPPEPAARAPRERVPARQPRALTEVERKELRRVLNSPEHVDEAPATVYAKLLVQHRRTLWLCRRMEMSTPFGPIVMA